MKIKKNKLWNYLMVIYIFQMGIFQPIQYYTGDIWLVFVNMVMVVIAFYVLKDNCKIYSVMLILILAIIFLFLSMISTIPLIEVYPYTLEVFMKALAPLLIGMGYFTYYSEEASFLYFNRGSVLNLLIIILSFYTGFHDMDYMRLGYAILPSTLFFMEEFGTNKNFKNLILFFISLSFQVIYGARGTVIPILLFFFIVLNRNVNISKRFVLYIIIILVSIFFIKNISSFLFLIEIMLSKLNRRSYSLLKFRLALEQGIAASSSGRDVLYSKIMKEIVSNPFKIRGFGYSYVKYGTAHNFLLQLLLEFGVIIFLVISMFFLWFKANYKGKIKEKSYLIRLLFSISFGRLLVSSDIFLRHENYFLLSIIITFLLGVEKKNVKSVTCR